MNKVLAATSLALFGLVLNPIQTHAEGNTPQTRFGKGWLEGKALNSMPWIHFHGPLYNYGPYTAPGHEPMFVKYPHFGAYVPAYPPAYYGYENPPYYPNTIAPYFPARPAQTLTAPTNLYYSQGEPPLAAPMASAPTSGTSPVVVEPAPATSSYSGRTPLFSGQFRSTGFRR